MCSPCLCTLLASAFIHLPIPTLGRLLLDIFLVSALFCYAITALALAVDASSAHLHRQMASNSYTLRSELCRSYAQNSVKVPSLENSLATGGCFERKTYRVTALACMVEERKKEF